MFVLAILLLAGGALVALAFGSVGSVIGALMAMTGVLLFWLELRRRRRFEDAEGAAPHSAADPRPAWQLVLIILASIVVSIVSLVALFWRLSAGLVDTTNAFFDAVKAGNLEKAQTFLSKDFRASTSEEKLRQFLGSTALDRYESASWPTRSFKNSQANLAGTVRINDGVEIPLTVTLLREDGEWKILSLRKPASDLALDSARDQPPKSEHARMVRETTEQFVDAIARRDFNDFHAHCAKSLRDETSAQQVLEAFRSVVDYGLDLRPIAAAEPQITAVGFDSGYFGFEGNYTLHSKTVSFRYMYIQEDSQWKLAGINVNIR